MYTNTDTHTCTHTQKHANTYTHKHNHTHPHTQRTHTRTHAHTHKHARTHTHKHTHTHAVYTHHSAVYTHQTSLYTHQSFKTHQSAFCTHQRLGTHHSAFYTHQSAFYTHQSAFYTHQSAFYPRRLEGQGTANAGSNIAQLAQLFLDPGQIGRWVHCGASPSGLIGEIGALLCSTDVEQLVQEKLENVRAFINHHTCVLENPTRWPVLHLVEQLASQETDCTFRPAPTGTQTSVDLEKTPAIHAFIEQVNPRQWFRAFRLTMRGGIEMDAVAFSPDGSRLARAEGCLLVVCDARTGFVESTLTGHSGK